MARLKILLVDDDRMTVIALARLLRGVGHEVYVAGSVAEAVATAESQPLDLLITDISLPDGTGYELVRELQKHYSFPAIALSGWGKGEFSDPDTTFSRYLMKPVAFDALLTAVNTVAPTPLLEDGGR